MLHALTSVLLFLVMLRMTRDLWPSAWVAAIFAIHPLHVSTVVWVAERRELLAGLFFVLTLAAYAWYVEPLGAARIDDLRMLALSLMSKPVSVTAPFVLLLLDYWPLARFRDTDVPGPADRRRARLRLASRGLVGAGKVAADGAVGGQLRADAAYAPVEPDQRAARSDSADRTGGQCLIGLRSVLAAIFATDQLVPALSALGEPFAACHGGRGAGGAAGDQRAGDLLAAGDPMCWWFGFGS